MVPLNLNFTDACACIFIACKTSVLHAVLACALVPVNTCDTQGMHIVSSHLICYTTCVMHIYSNYSYV